MPPHEPLVPSEFLVVVLYSAILYVTHLQDQPFTVAPKVLQNCMCM